MDNPWSVYELLLDKACSTAVIEELIIGLTWTRCRAGGTGLAMSPAVATRTLPWPGTLRGQAAIDIAGWVRSWQAHDATVGMATLNALLNQASPLLAQAQSSPATFLTA